MSNHVNDVLSNLDSTFIINLTISIWSGQKVMSLGDYTNPDELPPQVATTLGSKKMIDPKRLSSFNALKQQARRLLLSHGVNFLGGYAIPLEKKDEVLNALEGIQEEWEKEEQELLFQYDSLVVNWAERFAGFSEKILKAAPSAADLSEKFGFSYTGFQIQSNQELEALASNTITSSLLEEVKKTTGEMFEKHFFGQSEAGITTRLTLENLFEKVKGLATFDKSLSQITELLEEALGCYAQEFRSGRQIVGEGFYKLSTILSCLKDDDLIRHYLDTGETSIPQPATPAAVVPEPEEPKSFWF